MGKGPTTSSAVKRMISKFKTMECLDDRSYNGQPSTSANAAQTVQEEMEIVAVSYTHGEVRYS